MRFNELSDRKKDAPHSVSRLRGRRMGKPLTVQRRTAMQALFPRLEIPASIIRERQDIDPASLFAGRTCFHCLEIGFGTGEHLAGLKAQHPDWGFIGAEPFLNGMAAFLNLLDGQDTGNVRVYMDDGIKIALSLTAASLDEIYVLNPDPWPKKRHWKRRIINRENLDVFACILKPGGRLIMSTDVGGLAEWMTTETIRHPAFRWTARTAADWSAPPASWIPTKYEEKGIRAGRRQSYLIFQRL